MRLKAGDKAIPFSAETIEGKVISLEQFAGKPLLLMFYRYASCPMCNLRIRDFAQHFPARLNRILEALATNDLRLKVEVIDHGSIIDGLQKVANRIALGLVLAALIVGAAMLMQVPTAFTMFGYPGLAILLFLGAAAGGIGLAWTIVVGDARKTRLH